MERAEQAKTRPLTCPRCHGPAGVIETTTGTLDWGPAVIDPDGTVRPADPNTEPPYINAENSGLTTAYGACYRDGCGHQWKLRRRFDPVKEDA